jgi:di/tricarboxylate transporter
MLHLKEEGRQLLQSILVTSLISKETCWTFLIIIIGSIVLEHLYQSSDLIDIFLNEQYIDND